MARTRVLRTGDQEYTVTTAEGQALVNGGDPVAVSLRPDGSLRIGDDPPATAWSIVHGDTRWVFLDGQVYTFEAVTPGSRRRTGGHHGTLAAPMPATVVRIQATEGDRVNRGDVLIILEAMKMELPVKAPFDGTVSAVNCRAGELVQPGVGLIEIDEISS
jgi:acetyl-CoA/propionyl-CoA carboxylase, biotin carboxylase, biotin carboxyl carrier protein